MKNILVVFIILFTASSDAQIPETKFLKKESIKWAAFISDTFRFTNSNLSLQIREDFDKGKIKIFHPSFDSHGFINKEMTKKDFEESVRGVPISVIDSVGNEIGSVQAVFSNPLFDSSKFDEEINALAFVEQFIYIDKCRVKTNVSWVSPVMKIIMTSGDYLGNSYVFNAYHNTASAVSKSTRKKAIFLGSTERLYTDSSLREQSIKQWFGQNFAQALWPTLSSSQVDIYRLDSMKKIAFVNMTSSITDFYEITTTTQTMLGLLVATAPPEHPVDPARMIRFKLFQNWYYSPQKKIVFNDITAIIFYAIKTREGYSDTETSPVLKIVYR